MKNFIQKGDTITVQSPAGGAASGTGVLIGSLFGVAAYTAPAGAPLEIAVCGVFDLAKSAGVSFAVGAKVFWDATAKAVTSVSTNNSWIGVATVAANNSANTLRTRLNHMPI